MGTKTIGALTEDDIEAFFTHLQALERAASTRNKYVQAIKALFRWAVKKGYLQRNPVDPETIKRGKHAKRHRRLTPDVSNEEGKVERDGEERRLLAVARPHLQNLIIAALESCCRRGELLSLIWADVDLTRKELTVRADKAKTHTTRILPVSARLAAVLEMARTALDAQLTAAEGGTVSADAHQRAIAAAYVFGDAIGGRVKSIKRAWATAVLKAHGYTPTWTKGSQLAPASRAALEAIDLDFHDLRHEGGSRLLETGWPLHHVQHMLGHENLSQTSTYLNATKMGLRDSMRRYDESAPRCNPVATEATIEPPLDCNEDTEERPKDHLH